MFRDRDPFSDVPLVKMSSLFNRNIIVLDYAIVAGHTKPGGRFIRKDYVTRHIVIMVQVDGKKVRVKSESRNLEMKLIRSKSRLLVETTIYRTSCGPRFSKFSRV